MKAKEKQALEAKAYLLGLGIKAGDEIQTIMRSVSASGMNRKISVIYKGENISWYVAKLLEENPTEKFGHWALNVSGCGMDMGFNTVYRMSRRLFPGGFKPMDAGKTYGRNGTKADEVDADGGYALTQKWL
jgi:hypothetical protein